MSPVMLDGRTLTVAQLAAVADGAPVALDDSAARRMRASVELHTRHGHTDVVRQKWAWIVGGTPPINRDAAIRVFIEGHCAGVGSPLPVPVVRATMAARANVLATGLSACRPEAAQALVAMLNAQITPVVPAEGSVGAAGCTSLAHIARVVCGYGGEAYVDGQRVPAFQAMGAVDAFCPTEKEALSLINGSTLAAATAALAVDAAARFLRAADSAAALSLEVCRADLNSLVPQAHEARGHAGPARVAARLRDQVKGSELVAEGRKPDSFAIRCTPAVHGAAWDALEYVRGVVDTELNAAVDNPLVFESGVVETGNFHGAAVGLAMDHLKVALTQVATIADRRIYRLTYGELSGLPSFLVQGTGVNSGLMLAQYTAASLTSECRGLAQPASVHAIPTVQHHEDHVPMATLAARSAARVADLLADVVAIELLCAAQGLDLRLDGDTVGDNLRIPAGRPGLGTRATWQAVRSLVDRWVEDRVLHTDLAALGAAVRDGHFG